MEPHFFECVGPHTQQRKSNAITSYSMGRTKVGFGGVNGVFSCFMMEK